MTIAVDLGRKATKQTCAGVNNSPVQNNRKCIGDNMCIPHRQLNSL